MTNTPGAESLTTTNTTHTTYICGARQHVIESRAIILRQGLPRHP
ncbi:hypothetical protein E2C01_058379 [Portunus trituberculatus]|uniref:Uncharacterized protein n=1 Tax=Portunus trituberculatus TaxID=210409 RepID=A0A5B7H4J4_PORTR|nr:hypothetical protein [Portunus trituberculatus]